MTVIARFVWHDGYIDSSRVNAPLLLMWKRIVPQTNIMEWQSGESPVPFERQTVTFQLVRFSDGSFEYREVTRQPPPAKAGGSRDIGMSRICP